MNASDGRTYCFGSAERGILGDAHARDSVCTANGFSAPCRVAPMPVSNDPGFVALSASAFNSCGLTANGTAYCWGSGQNGLLEFAHDGSAIPVKIQTFADFRTLTVGSSFACGITTLDTTNCWGANNNGQLGNPAPIQSDTPYVMVPNRRFTGVSAGRAHACGVTADGSVYCWGSNFSGELGRGSLDTLAHPVSALVAGTQKFVAVEAGGAETCALTSTGAAWCWGTYYNSTPPSGNVSPAPVAGGLAFKAISVGSAENCGITQAGAAYCWTTTYAPMPVSGGHAFASIAVGDYHACGITPSSEMWCWGWGHDGQLGSTAGLKEICFGSDDSYPCTSVPVKVEKP